MKIGVIGCGQIAQMRHIPEFAENPNCELTGFYDLSRTRTQEVAKKYGGKVYETAEELILDKEIDAVSVCVANYAHAEIVVKALESGKDVLCEKPMATNLLECESMISAAKKAGKRLLIAQNQRFAEAHQKAKELIESGYIGKIVSFRTTFGHGGPETWSIDPGKNTWFFDKSRAVMGVMADLGVHKTDVLRYMTGQDVVRTTARLCTIDKKGPDGKLIGVDDNAICIYELSGGAVGTMTASWTFYGPEDNTTIFYGTKGIMRIYEDKDHSIVCRMADGSVECFDVGAIQTNENQTKSGVIDEFVSAVTEERSSILDAEEIINSMKAVFASIESSSKGIPVEVKI